jgi:tyrosyl-tRNA synthetase
MGVKKRLARTIVTEFWGEAAANEAEERFERTFQRKETPDELPEFAVPAGTALVDAIVAAGLAPSKREARRLLEQGAVSVDGSVQHDGTQAVGPGQVVHVGKRRWVRFR